jgi:hypothetical protein
LALLRHIDERVTIHLLTTEDKVANFNLEDEIFVEVVPRTFRPAKAKFKARSLEWFRRSKQLGDCDWVLHLDEETIIDTSALYACLDFIRGSTYEIGQVRKHTPIIKAPYHRFG